MSGIERLEDINAWQKARDLAELIYHTIAQGDFARDYSLNDQISRASVSAMNNIAEGYARQTDNEFVDFLYVALGSVAEVQNQLNVARDLTYISSEQFKRAYELSSETAGLINGFIEYLRRTDQ